MASYFKEVTALGLYILYLSNMNSLVFNLGNLHTGDLLLALPCITGLQQQGYEVGVFMMERYYRPVKHLVGVSNLTVTGKGLHNIRPLIGPDKHQTQSWIDGLQRKGYEGITVPLPRITGKSGTVLLQPWCEDRGKMFPVRLWNQLARTARSLGYEVMVGGPAVYATQASRITEAANFCGKDTGKWADTVAKAEVVVSVDSGAAHLADALGKKILTIFSTTSANKWAPFWNSAVANKNNATQKLEDLLNA
jgi:ADP-heptose:LPS heptosyltransferase